jgi:hypothetical protein
MTKLEKKVQSLKQHVKKEVEHILLEGASELFKNNGKLTSFGWFQHTSIDAVNRYIKLENSLYRPDISGALGYMIYPSIDTYPLQQEVAKFLKQFDPVLLHLAFGDQIEITVYNDNTIEFNPYDLD